MNDKKIQHPAVSNGSALNQDVAARTPCARVPRPIRWLAGVAFALSIVSGAAAGDEYPTHPIRLLVGFSAGGGLDISCRHWAQRLSARIGQQVIVENRPGASGELAVKQ